ncbi:hypothetical protein R83H12_01563 [Fibrobacteria bacterium R8-3-H12]
MKKFFIPIVPLLFALISCGEHGFDELDDIGNVLKTGLLPSENPELIPQDIKSFSTANASSLPASVSIESKFPPIGDQNPYGTCAVWSGGYAFKTALNAIDKNWSSSDLAKPANQTSPKDLWMIIPSSKKVSGCAGTQLDYVLDALQKSGAASMADVPYNKNNMSDFCDASSSTAKGNPNNKLANYRRIDVDGMDVNNFKNYLAQGRPIYIGAKLGDRFMRWSNASVINSDTYNEPGMQHARHAMVLVGYDDSKGMNGAFRVRNSWGTKWGDNGSIWVDYNFFVTNFCFIALVAQNLTSPDNPNPPASGSYDLLANFAEDYPDPENASNPRARVFSYEVRNNGATEILASQRWSVYYFYYNAYNAKEYKIIFEDYYTNEYGKPCTKPDDFDNQVCWGKLNNTNALAGGIWNNMNIKPGKIAGEAEAGEVGFEIPYTMPNITGDYYLVVKADSKDTIKESNEENNFYFITTDGGKPLRFENGVMKSKPMNSNVLAKRSKPAPVHSVVDLGELNAYTPQEIRTLLNIDKNNGVLAKKIAQYREENFATPVKRIRRQ